MSNISTLPREDKERRKQKRDYNGFSFTEQYLGEGKTGILVEGVKAVGIVSLFSYILKMT